VKTEENQLVQDFVQQLRLQQLRLKVDLRTAAVTKPFMEEPKVKANVARLEALDRLSLHFCLKAEQDAVIDGVPMNSRGEEVDIELHNEGANVVAIGPYPFRRNPLSFSIMARRVPKRVYASELDFQKVLGAAQYFPLRFTMRARRGSAFSQVAGS
jgi:hypothetical protein